MGADLIITFSILWGLYRTRTGWHHNDKVIYRLIRMTLEAQAPPLLLTSVYTIIFSMLLSKAQLTPAVIYLTHQLSAYINNSKLNAIGLMYSLNSRAAFMHHDVSMANPGVGASVERADKTGHRLAYLTDEVGWRCLDHAGWARGSQRKAVRIRAQVGRREE